MMLSREHSNGTSRFIPGYEFLVQLSDCQLLKKDCANVTANPLQCVWIAVSILNSMLTVPIFLCVQPPDVRGSDAAVYMIFEEWAYSSVCVPGFKQETRTYSLLFLGPQPKWRCCLREKQTHLYHRVLLSSATQQGLERSKWSFVILIWTSLRLRCVSICI